MTTPLPPPTNSPPDTAGGALPPPSPPVTPPPPPPPTWSQERHNQHRAQATSVYGELAVHREERHRAERALARAERHVVAIEAEHPDAWFPRVNARIVLDATFVSVAQLMAIVLVHILARQVAFRMALLGALAVFIGAVLGWYRSGEDHPRSPLRDTLDDPGAAALPVEEELEWWQDWGPGKILGVGFASLLVGFWVKHFMSQILVGATHGRTVIAFVGLEAATALGYFGAFPWRTWRLRVERAAAEHEVVTTTEKLKAVEELILKYACGQPTCPWCHT